MNAGAAEFDQRISNSLVWCEIKLPRTVEPQIAFSGNVARLHTVGSNDVSRDLIHDDKVVAELIELILVETGKKRFRRVLREARD